jgi:hypothetical protein
MPIIAKRNCKAKNIINNQSFIIKKIEKENEIITIKDILNN